MARAGIGGSGYAKPLPPTTPLTQCLQQCFEQYLKNHERCKSLFCDTFLFITLSCDDADYAMCKAHAEDLIDSCIAGCVVANP